MRVAVVDDSHDFINIIKLVFDNFAEVVEIPLDRVFDYDHWMNIDLALVDLNLDRTDLTGIDVLRWLSLHAKHVRRVVITAEMPGSRVVQALETLGLAERILDKATNLAEWKKVANGA